MGDDTKALRRLVARARLAAEDPLRPVLLLLPEHSTWLHGALPPELRPAVAISQIETLIEAVAQALAQDGEPAPHTTARAPAALLFDPRRRRLSGPGGSTRLTPSEGVILDLLRSESGAVATHDRIALELWGSVYADRHSRASIRSHVHTLRRKLREVGLDGAIASLPGIGYRLVDGLAE